jgi:hypothetical protein
VGCIDRVLFAGGLVCGINRGGSLDYLSQSVTGTIAASLADVRAMARAFADRVVAPARAFRWRRRWTGCAPPA